MLFLPVHYQERTFPLKALLILTAMAQRYLQKECGTDCRRHRHRHEASRDSDILVTKKNSVKLQENSLAEKSPEVLVETKLNSSQQGDLATKAAHDTLDRTRQNIASSWREVTLSLCSPLCLGLGYLIRNCCIHAGESPSVPLPPHPTPAYSTVVGINSMLTLQQPPVPAGMVLSHLSRREE